MHVRRVFVLGAWTMIACSSSKPDSGGLPDAPTPPDAAPDLMTDVHNCGAIGHACGCGSTSCTSGRCDSHPLADKQGAPTVLPVNGGASPASTSPISPTARPAPARCAAMICSKKPHAAA